MLYPVQITLDKDAVLTKSQLKGITSRRKYWWLKSTEDGFGSDIFYDIGEIEGNIPFSKEVHLPTGKYTIGCGTPKCAIRFDFKVRYTDSVHYHYESYNTQLEDILVEYKS